MKRQAFKNGDKNLTNQPAEKFYEFGEFRLDAKRCVLFGDDNRIVDATPKALEILCVLVEAGGSLVSKEEIISRVWADRFVEEANLSHHVFRLRRTLGECAEQKFIETIPKRGYRFVAPIREAAAIGEFQNAESKNTESNDAQSEIEDRRQTAAPRPFAPRSLIISAAAAALLIFIGAAFFWFNTRRADDIAGTQKTKFAGGEPMTISLVTNNGKVGGATISPDGKFIVYSQNYSSAEGILYIRQTDTNSEAQLLKSNDMTFGAKAFSPDSASVYYVVWDARDTNGALYRISVLGGEPSRILSNVGHFFTLSPDGGRAAFFRTDKEQKKTSIIIAALDGSGAERVVHTFDDLKQSTDSVPAFSPDGKRLAFALADEPNAVDLPPARVGVFTIEIDGGAIKKLTDEKWIGIGMMNWMPDQSGVVFVGAPARSRNQLYFLSYPAGDLTPVTKELGGYGNYGMGITADGKTLVGDSFEYSSQLWTIGADGRSENAVQLTTGDGDGARGLNGLPDGRLVYASRTGSDYDLWTLRDSAGSREGKPLTSGSFFEAEPVASIDGKFIIFASDRAGGQHLFRIDEDGANLKQLTFGDGFDSMPDVSPDGESIVYASFANNRNRIWKMPTGGGAATPLTDYECVSPSFSPDGKRVACVVPSESRAASPRLDIVSYETGARLKSFDVLPFDYYYCPPRWTPDGKGLVYRRTDLSAGNLWKQRTDGGAPVRLTDFKTGMIYNFAYARDGRNLLISRGNIKVNVVLLKNFKPE